jgi:hypothetical protein
MGERIRYSLLTSCSLHLYAFDPYSAQEGDTQCSKYGLWSVWNPELGSEKFRIHRHKFLVFGSGRIEKIQKQPLPGLLGPSLPPCLTLPLSGRTPELPAAKLRGIGS